MWGRVPSRSWGPVQWSRWVPRFEARAQGTFAARAMLTMVVETHLFHPRPRCVIAGWRALGFWLGWVKHLTGCCWAWGWG